MCIRDRVKGVDVLLDAIARLRDAGRTVTATLVGDGPEREALQAQVARHGLGGAVHFMRAMPARQALALGRIMVVPSRTESLPYVVLESAAGGKPLITTKVGGIPEIYGPLSNTLVPPVDAATLAQAIIQTLDHPDATAEIARQLRGQVQTAFSVDTMAVSYTHLMPRILVFLAHKTRPNPRKSGSPLTSIGTTAGAGTADVYKRQ